MESSYTEEPLACKIEPITLIIQLYEAWEERKFESNGRRGIVYPWNGPLVIRMQGGFITKEGENGRRMKISYQENEKERGKEESNIEMKKTLNDTENYSVHQTWNEYPILTLIVK